MTKKTNTPKKVVGKVAAKKASKRASPSGTFMGLIVQKGPAMPNAPGTGGTGVKAKSGNDAS